MSTARPDIAVIGGSGFYEFFTDATEVAVETPFGPPSEPPLVGQVAGRDVAFIPRHGRKHRLPPHRVNYRANLWALRSIGVRQVIAPCAVGGLIATLRPGSLVVPDQIIDRTWGRDQTIYDQPRAVLHVGFADPYCPAGRATAVRAAADAGVAITDGGTLVVINGPRFSTRAESQWHVAMGGTIVGMTGMPEAAIARELAMCYTSIALVTDSDAGVAADDAVTHAAVLEAFDLYVGTLRAVVERAVAILPAAEADDVATCACRRCLDGQRMPFALP